MVGMMGPRRGWLFPLILTALMSCPCLAEEAALPIIHVAETVRRLPVVFEGQHVSAIFSVQNQGRVALEIVKVTPS
jgi:hypothetical protein